MSCAPKWPRSKSSRRKRVSRSLAQVDCIATPADRDGEGPRVQEERVPDIGVRLGLEGLKSRGWRRADLSRDCRLRRPQSVLRPHAARAHLARDRRKSRCRLRVGHRADARRTGSRRSALLMATPGPRTAKGVSDAGPLQARGSQRGAGVRKPRKEETARRKGAVWLGGTYGDLKIADESHAWLRGAGGAQ